MAPFLLAACSREPPKSGEMRVSIHADNHCTLEDQRVDCAGIAAKIREKYPASSPRIDVCLDQETRFEVATGVIRAVEAAGFPVGTLDCTKSGRAP